MGVANSRLLMLPNSEIRQNEGRLRDSFGMPSGLGIRGCQSGIVPQGVPMLALLRVLRLRNFIVIASRFYVEMCGGYVCTLNCVKYRFIIRFIVALPVEP